MEKARWVVIGVLVLVVVVVGSYNYFMFGAFLGPIDNSDGCPGDWWCTDGGKCVNGICSCVHDEDNPDYCSAVGCVNHDTDNSHCGECDTICLGGHTCQEGSCDCSEGWDDCGTAFCFDLQNDPEHCGACWNFLD